MTSIFFLGLAFSFLLFLVSKYRKAKLSSKLPPGKTGWPILGETLDYVQCPAQFIRDRMIKHSPDVFQTSLAGEKMAVFCGPLGNKFIYSNEAKLKAWIPRTFVQALSLKTIDRDSPSLKLFNEQFQNFLKLESLQHFVPVKDDELAGQILGVLFAGFNSTSNAITFVISSLAEYPHVYAKVLQGM